MSKRKIYIHPTLKPHEAKALKEGISDTKLIFHQDLAEMEARSKFVECEVAFGNPPLEWLFTSSNLKWIQLGSVGLDPYKELIKEDTIKFSNLKGFFSTPVAETAVGAILTLYRNTHHLIEAQQSGVWLKERYRKECDTLSGKSILILGQGSIGQRIGGLLTAFGGQVSFFGSRTTLKGDLTHLEILLQNLDILIGCLPESESTINLLNKRRLSFLPQRAILINVGRGSLIDENALISRLKAGKLKGAFLDVTCEEPISGESKLWEAPNLILSQHTAGGYREEMRDKLRFFVENYKCSLDGNLKNLVSL